MRIANEFTIAADPESAYALLLDLERVAPCIPGGELGAQAEDGSYSARVTVRLGPMRLTYEGTMRISARDDAARRAVLSGTARDARGQGGAEAEMTMQVIPADGSGARVEIVTELRLSGRAAQMGRGVIEEVARRLVGEMASCLETRVLEQAAPESAPPAPVRPVRALPLMLVALRARLNTLFRRGKGERHA